MYKISSSKRKYSSTPISRIDKDGKEEEIMCSFLRKEDGDKLSLEIIESLRMKTISELHKELFMRYKNSIKLFISKIKI